MLPILYEKAGSKDKDFVKKIVEDFYINKLISEQTILNNLIKATKNTNNNKIINECLLMIGNIIDKYGGSILKGNDIQIIASYVNAPDKYTRENSLICLSNAYKF